MISVAKRNQLSDDSDLESARISSCKQGLAAAVGNQKPDSSNSGFNKLVINVQDMNYSFKVLGCEFTYLGEIK